MSDKDEFIGYELPRVGPMMGDQTLLDLLMGNQPFATCA